MYEIKKQPEDFLVEEITPNNKVLEIGKKYKFDKKSKGEQTICVLEKKNWDTIGALKEVANRLRVSSSRIGFAGMGPKFEDFCDAVIEFRATPTIICESSGTQDLGALKMKKYFEKNGAKVA